MERERFGDRAEAGRLLADTLKAGCPEALAVARAEPVLSSATALRRFAPEQAHAL